MRDDFKIGDRWIRAATGKDTQSFNICRPGWQPREGEDYEQTWRIRDPNPPLTPRRYQAAPTIEALLKLVADAGGVQES